MRTITRTSFALLGAAALTGLAIVPAYAADDTTVEITAGALEITTAEAGLDLSNTAPGGTATGSIAGVTVSDLRAVNTGWDASATITAFVNDPAVPANTTSMAGTVTTYTAGTPVVTGTVTFGAIAATPLSATPAEILSAATVSGNNTAAWTGALSVAIPTGALSGTYGAVLTHSVLAS